jgi:hypothetical protein
VFPPNTDTGGGYVDGLQPKFNGPYGVTFDLEGHLLVADCQNHKIRKVHKDTFEVTTIAGSSIGYLGRFLFHSFVLSFEHFSFFSLFFLSFLFLFFFFFIFFLFIFCRFFPWSVLHSYFLVLCTILKLRWRGHRGSIFLSSLFSRRVQWQHHRLRFQPEQNPSHYNAVWASVDSRRE